MVLLQYTISFCQQNKQKQQQQIQQKSLHNKNTIFFPPSLWLAQYMPHIYLPVCARVTLCDRRGLAEMLAVMLAVMLDVPLLVSELGVNRLAIAVGPLRRDAEFDRCRPFLQQKEKRAMKKANEGERGGGGVTFMITHAIRR